MRGNARSARSYFCGFSAPGTRTEPGKPRAPGGGGSNQSTITFATTTIGPRAMRLLACGEQGRFSSAPTHTIAAKMTMRKQPMGLAHSAIVSLFIARHLAFIGPFETARRRSETIGTDGTTRPLNDDYNTAVRRGLLIHGRTSECS